MKKNKVFLFLAMLLSLTLACNLSNITGTGSTPVDGVDEPDAVLPTPTPIPSVPVSIRTGLASLNTYSMVIESNTYGPTQGVFSEMLFEIQQSNDQNANSTRYVSSQLAEGDSEANTTDSITYTIGNASCSGSDVDGWDYSETTPQESEMQNLFGEMMDFIPLIDNPSFVGSESMNGIMTNHFTFQVSGLGLESGAQVTANQGDYWLAQDGQYIVKYYLVTETMDPTTQATLRMEVLIDLTSINQPVNITFPVGCAP